MLLEFAQSLRRGSTENVVNLRHLVELVGAGKERIEREHFKENAANTPHIHLVVVETIREQALGSAIPTCRDVLRVRLRHMRERQYVRSGQQPCSVLLVARVQQMVHAALVAHIYDLCCSIEPAHLAK